jgi:2-keto-4-pentenoate hydratase/2-oxohepta-3-ene-1,7-dioic acid hydratase in catechol pathway
MKFVSFERPNGGGRRFGLMVKDNTIADIALAYAALVARDMPPGMAVPYKAKVALDDAHSFIAGGDYSLTAARQVVQFLSGKDAGNPSLTFEGNRFLLSTSEVRLLAPITRPRKFIAAGKNFSEHMAEMSSRIPLPRRPVAFAQMMTTIVGPETTIPYPPETQKLDYEVEVAVVIGKPAYRISADAAHEHIFGYTIFNDISARDIYRGEQTAGIPLLGKNFPSFSPLGPVLCTRDEFTHSADTRLQMRVNGEMRQDGTLASMIFNIDHLIAYWSQIGLTSGDILTTGTPSGVAAGRKPEETPWWLKPGDVVEAEVSGLGVLRNIIGSVVESSK